jgi:glycosyltransferase involved in cell wall biosynthesis
MDILIIDDKVPDPHFGAGFPRAHRLMLSLIELGHTIHFFPTLKNTIADLDPEMLAQFNVHVYDDIKKVKKVDVAILSRPHNVHYYLPVVKETFPFAKTIYDTEALWFRRYDLQMETTGRLPGWAYRYDEIGLALQVDACFVVNDEEKGILEGHGVKKVVKLGHALDINRNGLAHSARKDFLVVGGKLEDDSSNEDALWWFLENCWEAVNRDNQATLNVTGLVTSNRLLNHVFREVNLMGHVADLIPLYESHRVFVATTRFATGIPWKVHEAMANGIPCVISPLLAKQLGVTDGKEAYVASTPERCLAVCSYLYQDATLWYKMREEGYNLVKRDCDPNNFKQIIATTLGSLVG